MLETTTTDELLELMAYDYIHGLPDNEKTASDKDRTIPLPPLAFDSDQQSPEEMFALIVANARASGVTVREA